MKSKHFLKNKDVIPGVGSYNIPVPKMHGLSLGSRTIIEASNANPGPGAYADQFALVKHKSPQFSMRSRPINKKIDFVPGPG